MKKTISTLCLIALVGASNALAQNGDTPRAEAPQPRLERVWTQYFQSQKQALVNASAEGPVDVCFVGDSLTQYWLSEGAGPWLLEFDGINRVNYGISADRTEHILWRIENGEFAKYPAKTYVLMAGTNNLGNSALGDDADVVFSALQTIIATIRTAAPDSAIHVLALPPNGPNPQSALNRETSRLNRMILETDLGETVSAHALPEAIATEAAGWKPGMTIDGLHFSPRAYELLAAYLTEKLTN